MSQHNAGLLETNGLDNLGTPRAAVVYTEWNDKIIRELVNGFESTFHKFHGDITGKVVVPGAFELPFAIKQLWEYYSRQEVKPEVIVAFGAVIRGGTPHFEYVSQAVTDGILQLNLTLPVPVIFGVLTLDTEEQAWERLGGTHGHKGEEAAITALKMIKNSRRFS